MKHKIERTVFWTFFILTLTSTFYHFLKADWLMVCSMLCTAFMYQIFDRQCRLEKQRIDAIEGIYKLIHLVKDKE